MVLIGIFNNYNLVEEMFLIVNINIENKIKFCE